MFGIDEIKNRGLFNWFSSQNPTLYSGYIFSGVSTNWLSKCICLMIGLEKLPNLVHISGEPIDKAELLMLFDKEAFLKKLGNRSAPKF